MKYWAGLHSDADAAALPSGANNLMNIAMGAGSDHRPQTAAGRQTGAAAVHASPNEAEEDGTNVE